MENNLEYSLEVGLEEQYPSLYSWYIQENDEAGSPIGEKQIPWRGYHHFALKGVRYHTSIQRQFKDDLDREYDFGPTEVKPFLRRISGWLKPEDDVAYSMFGTERDVGKISFSVTPVSCADTSDEAITIMGGVSYTAEIDFRDSTEPDWLAIDITVSDESFNFFVEQVLRGNIQGQLSVGSPEGFYSEWSPALSAQRLKVLNQLPDAKWGKWVEPDQRLVHKTIPDASSVNPPRLGYVREFSLSFSNSSRLNKSSRREVSDDDQ